MIELACQTVYEAITGNHWCNMKPAGTATEKVSRQVFKCTECGYQEIQQIGSSGHVNPPLATSLDAWRPLWEAMTYEQLQPYFNYLLEVSIDYMHKHGIEAPAQHYLFFATPMHHLIAALLMLGHDELAEKVRESCGR